MLSNYYTINSMHSNEEELRQLLKQFRYLIPGVEYTTSSEFTMNPELEEEGIIGADIFNIPEEKYTEALIIARKINLYLKRNFGFYASIVLHNKPDTEQFYRNILNDIRRKREIFRFRTLIQSEYLYSNKYSILKNNCEKYSFDTVKRHIKQIIACEAQK
jgi:hypothetical protein